MADVFQYWSDDQLRSYLAESGRPAPAYVDRQGLLNAAVATARDAATAAAAPRAAAGAGARAPPPPAAAASPPVPAAMPPAGGKRKKAFICGINYFRSSAELRGCINDAQCMEYFLKTKFGFCDHEILVFRDDHPNPAQVPTRANIFAGWAWLLAGARAGDALVFHYSGHGGQARDFSGDEADGANETLLPVDFRRAGEIVDDDVNRALVNPLPQGVKLHAVIDACHSGSVLDLEYQAHWRPPGHVLWEPTYTRGPPRVYKGTAGGFAVQFSASRDEQTAADTAKLNRDGVATGAATFSFIKAVEQASAGGGAITYGALVAAMHYTLQQAGLSGQGGAPAPAGGLDGLLFGLLMGGGGGGAGFRGQEPVMSSNYAFDLNTKFSLV